jgi:Trypsin-co-occurring domain 1
VTVELGIKLSTKAGIVIAEATGEANFKVTLHWKQGEPAPT